jgi:hypothetical protein
MNRKGLLLLTLFCIAGSWQTGMAEEQFGLRVGTARMMSVFGSRNDSTKMTDYLNPGMTYSFSIVHRFSPYYSVEVGADIGWMPVDEQYRQEPGKEPVFFYPRIYFSNLISFPWKRLHPYLRLGVSIAPWRITQDGPGGDAMLFEGEKFQKVSFDLHAGLGLEFSLFSWLSVYGDGRLDVLFCRDAFFFGKGFTEQGILSFGAGILVYLF